MGEKERLTSKFIKQEFDKYNWQGHKFFIKREGNLTYVNFNLVQFSFYYNRMYDSVLCKVQKNDNVENKKERYNLGELYDNKIIVYDEPVYDDQSDVSLEDYIKQFVAIINSQLMSVVKGDSSILNRAKEVRKNILCIQKISQKDFIFETEAYKKMINGDADWKSELP